VKKRTISKLFLYKHRYIIGYILLTLAFLGTLLYLPVITPNGLSEAEMQSTITSNNISTSSIATGEIIDLPYHLLQKACLHLFGLSPYTIKLPSIIIGFFLGILFIHLLNRWFKNNVAIIASIITVLSSSFLYLAGSGTPLIMLVFWPTLLLWLGSKIQGVKKPSPVFCFIFAIALLLSIFTPYMPYLALFILIYVLVHPHLRFTIKTLPKIPLVLVGIIVLAGCTLFGIILAKHHSALTELLFMENFSPENYLSNLSTAFTPVFSWSGVVESTFLAPLIGLASLALAITGLISTTKGFFASRNSIASYLIIFTILISGLNPDCAVLIILPLAILIAHGVRYILEKWYGLFPSNPYARVFGLIPISIFLGIMITSDISHFVFGYRYNPAVADNFVNDLTLIQENLDNSTTLLIPAGTIEYDFYSILEQRQGFNIESSLSAVPAESKVASLGKWAEAENLPIYRIITSSKSSNSDRIYLYEK